jgi:hypothetical protein
LESSGFTSEFVGLKCLHLKLVAENMNLEFWRQKEENVTEDKDVQIFSLKCLLKPQ